MQVLVTYLTQTLSPDHAVRKPAEDYLASVETQPGYSILLLQLADSEQADNSIRLSAAINFKNFVKRNWRVVVDEGNKVSLEMFLGSIAIIYKLFHCNSVNMIILFVAIDIFFW